MALAINISSSTSIVINEYMADNLKSQGYIYNDSDTESEGEFD